jgi:hypothetical protein
VIPPVEGGEFFYALIKKYKAGWSSLLRESVEESTLQEVLHPQPDISLDIVYTKIVIVIDTTKQIPIYISQIVINILLINSWGPIWGVYLFGIPPPP